MEGRKKSDIVKDFLQLLEECYDVVENQRKELSSIDRLKNDIEHKFELKNLNEQEMAALGREMQTCMWDRRKHKDLSEEIEPIKKYMDKYPKNIKNLELLYNELRAVEKRHKERYYTPRVMGQKNEKWFSEHNGRQNNEMLIQGEIDCIKMSEIIANALGIFLTQYSDKSFYQKENAGEHDQSSVGVSDDKEEDSFINTLLKIEIDCYENQLLRLDEKYEEITSFFTSICSSKRGVFSKRKRQIVRRVVEKMYFPLLQSYDAETNNYDYNTFMPTQQSLLNILQAEKSNDGVALMIAYKIYLEENHLLMQYSEVSATE